MSDVAEMTDVVIYTDRREFLLASVRDKRHAFVVTHDLDPIYGLAASEYQFRKALCEYLFPKVLKMSARDIQNAMAEELAQLAGAQ
jgi:hypothetical protein